MKRIAGLALAGAAGALVLAAGLMLQRQVATDANARVRGAIPAATSSTFRAVVCGRTPCVLVEAAGLRFLIGAGADAAAGLDELGALQGDLDAVLLTDLSGPVVEGLPILRRAHWIAGRAQPLTVIGPPGAEQVIDGANLLMAAADAIEVRRQPPGRLELSGAGLMRQEDRPQMRSGRATVLDTGVVSIVAFASDDPNGAAHWLYRIDVGAESLIVGDCSATPEALAQASQGSRSVAAILPARYDGDAGAPSCPSVSEWPGIRARTQLSAVLLTPLDRAASIRSLRKEWRAAIKRDEALSPGLPGARIDLTARGFQITAASEK